MKPEREIKPFALTGLIKAFIFLLFISNFGFPQFCLSEDIKFHSPLERAVFYEINRARTEPKGYASFLEKWKPYYDGTLIKFPGEVPIETKEGWKGVEEAILFLQSIQPIPPLTLSKGMSLGAKDHLRDLSHSGKISHTGSDGSQPWDRISRYGIWKKPVGENISFGPYHAQHIVIGLIIDDGVPGRGHRKNIFNHLFRTMGIACYQQAHYRTICVITFAGGYVEKK